MPTLNALKAGRPVAIANKEVLVMAGHLVRRAMAQGGGELRPVDSEHSAIWQCLWGEEGHAIRRILLTASGGAFRDFDRARLASVTAEQALNHPTWKMGSKITVDSATLMNKGMETIEAMWLFDVPMDKVEVVLHRESIVHSLVEFSDGSVKAQLGVPDMRLPIQLALAYPERMPAPPMPTLNLATIGTLHFGTPDMERFPCLRLAMEAGRLGATYPAAMAAADEVAVERFLAGEIGFLNLSILNMPRDASWQGLAEGGATGEYGLSDGDEPLGLYRPVPAGEGWGRTPARRFLRQRILGDPAIRAIAARTPPWFGDSHAFFFRGTV